MKKQKEIKIEVPDGYEIDTEKSTFEKIIFKEAKKKLTYEDISKFLFEDKDCWSIGSTENRQFKGGLTCYNDWDIARTNEQLESILALNKLCNVAKYLNGNWLPDLNNLEEAFIIEISENELTVEYYPTNTGSVFFKTEELAEQAIEILGEKEIRKALTLNH